MDPISVASSVIAVANICRNVQYVLLSSKPSESLDDVHAQRITFSSDRLQLRINRLAKIVQNLPDSLSSVDYQALENAMQNFNSCSTKVGSAGAKPPFGLDSIGQLSRTGVDGIVSLFSDLERTLQMFIEKAETK